MYWLSSQVLEACWGRFMERLPRAANLEGLIAAHSTFLEGLLKGALLGGSASASAQTGDLQAELQAALRSVAQLPTPVGKLQELVSHQSVKTSCCLTFAVETGLWQLGLCGSLPKLLKQAGPLLQSVAGVRGNMRGT